MNRGRGSVPAPRASTWRGRGVRAYFQAHFPPPAVTAAHPLQAQRPPNFPIHEWEEIQQLREDSPEETEAVGWDKYWNSPRSKESTEDRDYTLQWWKKHGTDYHSGCVEAAVAILAISGSEVDVERLFSSGKQHIQKRFLMNPRTMRIWDMFVDEESLGRAGQEDKGYCKGCTGCISS